MFYYIIDLITLSEIGSGIKKVTIPSEIKLFK